MSEYNVTYVELEKLRPSEYNARLQAKSIIEVEKEAEVDRLKEDIKRRGLLQPLVVRQTKDGYEVIAGFRRYLALKKLKEEDIERYRELFPNGIPVFIKNVSDRDALLISLSENLMQKTMSEEQIGASLERALQMGLDLNDVSRELQVRVENLRKALELWWNIKKVRIVPEAKPGRPSGEEKEARVGKAKIGIATTLAKKLRKKGVVRDEREFAKKFIDLTRDLSTSEVRLIAKQLRENPRLAEKPNGLIKIIEEVKEKDYVERIVALRKDVADFVSAYAKKNGLTFNEALNTLLLKIKELGI